MFDEKDLDRTDALSQCLTEIGGEMLPPPDLVKAAKAGVRLHRRVRTATHIRRFTGAVALYAACVALLLGSVFVLAYVFENVQSTSPVSTTPPIPPTSTTVTTQPPDSPPPETESGPEYPIRPDHFLEKIPDDLNFANMGLDEAGLTVRIAYVEGTKGVYTKRSFQADVVGGTLVNNATKDRNQLLKDQLGLQISATMVSDRITGMQDELGAELAAGNCPYDILAGYQYFGVGIAQMGYMLDLSDLSSYDADFIDLSAPYWANAYNEAMSYKGTYYWITGDIALRYLGSAYCTFVNNELYDTYLSAEYGPIFDWVKKGDWTMDQMAVLAAECYTRAQANQATDIYGFGYEPNDSMDGLFFGAGMKLTQRDRDTKALTLILDQTDETYQAFTNQWLALTGGEGSKRYSDMDGEAVMGAFARGNLLFTTNQLHYADYYKVFETDYSVLPMPKLNADQKDYLTTIHNSCTVFGIYAFSPRIPQAAAALEFLCAHSGRSVREHFLDSLVPDYKDSASQAEMIDLLYQGVTTDFAVVWGHSTDAIIDLFRDYKKGVDNTVSRNRKKWLDNLDKFTQSLDQLNPT